MKESFGTRLGALRKAKGLTQEQVAETLAVSPQAVSKWENDQSYPDITLLTKIAEMFSTTVDSLLGKEDKPLVEVVSPEKRKDINKMILRVNVHSKEGDKVKINMPMPLVIAGLDMGLESRINGSDAMKAVDFKKIIDMVEKGVIGKLVEVESANGDIVEVFVE